jgi:hypothetical protein
MLGKVKKPTEDLFKRMPKHVQAIRQLAAKAQREAGRKAFWQKMLPLK